MMKRVRINLGKVGIVNRKGDYDRVLTAGSYWIGMNEKVSTYDMSKVYSSNTDLNIMLQDEKFKAIAEIIDVSDNEIVLKYTRNNFDCVLAPGRYFYFKGLMDFKFVKIDLSDTESASQTDKSVMRNASIVPFRHEFKVESSEEGLLFIDGKFIRRLTKGLYFFWKNVTPVEVLKIDMRQIELEVSGQEILTKDKAALRVNFQANYRVIDAQKALLDSKDFQKQLYTLVQLGLREFVGTLTLDELLDAKEKVSDFVMKFLKLNVTSLGVEVLNAGIRDIILPGEVRDIMNQVLIAQKSAEANSIVRREETASTRTLLNTAKLMEDNQMLYKLKEMEYVEKIARTVGELKLSNGGNVMDQLTSIFSK
jgi:hypothetical protein